MNLGTILGIWAHPDDETYLSAGLMASAARKGNRVVCVTATRGEEGSWDEERWPTSELGRIREAELMKCLEILGVREHIWLDYYDGKCNQVPAEEALGKVTKIVEEVEPDSVLTFGPDGMTGHPDHIAVSQWATEAFGKAAKLGATLYYATTTPEWATEYAPRLQKFNVFGPGTPPVTPTEDLGINFELPPDIAELKLDAIEAHVSQVQGMLNAFGRDFFREGQRIETFRRA